VSKIQNDDRIQFMMRFDPEIKAWLDSESEKSGRSLTWLVEHAVQLWKNRLEVQRQKQQDRSLANASR